MYKMGGSDPNSVFNADDARNSRRGPDSIWETPGFA
jgi:hypothetical protein